MIGPTRRRQGGFTLIEVMAVVLLLGLVMSGVSVSLNRFVPSQQMDSECRQILAKLDLARSSAIAAGRPYTVELNLDEHEYRIFSPYDREGRIAKTKEDREDLGREVLESGINFAGILRGGNIVNEGVVELVFPASGQHPDVILYLSNDAGEDYDMTVSLGGLTGRAAVIEGHITPGTVRDEDFD